MSLGRRYLPGTRQRLITNGNYAFRNKIKTPLDEIIVSCDGYSPESYAQYRVGGSVERVLAFMADAVAESRGRPRSSGSTSCSPATIPTRAPGCPAGGNRHRCRHTALRVHALRATLGALHRARTVTSCCAGARAIVSTTPVQQRLDRHGVRRPLTRMGQLQEYSRRSRGLLHAIDEVQLLLQLAVYVRGWIAWDRKAVDRLEVRCNGRRSDRRCSA